MCICRTWRIVNMVSVCVDWLTGDYYDMCSICLEDFKVGDKLRILHCSHGQLITRAIASSPLV